MHPLRMCLALQAAALLMMMLQILTLKLSMDDDASTYADHASMTNCYVTGDA